MNTKDNQLMNLIEEIKKDENIKALDWAKFVKTSAGKERVPTREDWWQVRASSLLRKIQKYGPIGVNKLSKKYGSNKNRGVRPNKKCDGSRNITRKILQQLTKSNLIKDQKAPLRSGKILTKEGKELLNKTMEAEK
jgi:small subunit ribosomal protein S19e